MHSYVESNDQTELTSKTETDSELENRWQLVEGEGKLGGGGIDRGHGQQCGDCWEQGGIRGLNGNGKI